MKAIFPHFPFHIDDPLVEQRSQNEEVPEIKIKIEKHQLTILDTVGNVSK